MNFLILNKSLTEKQINGLGSFDLCLSKIIMTLARLKEMIEFDSDMTKLTSLRAKCMPIH